MIKSLQVVGGLALVITAYLSWRDLYDPGDQHLTGRFNKAVEQLNSNKLAVQLGGIHSLERIARKSPTDYGTIIKLLTAFIRGKAFFPSNSRDHLLKQFTWEDATNKEVYKPQGVSKDVQTALTVLGRQREVSHRLTLDLGNTNLSQANLRKANFKQANLYSAVLSQADFRGADLREASFLLAILSGGPKSRGRSINFRAPMTRFDQANLSLANFMGAFMSYQISFKDANLSMANLTDAQIECGCFHNANLQKTDFSRANLKEASFRMANLSDAILDNANLRETDFRGAKNLTIEQVKAAKHWRQAKYDSAFKKKLDLN
ncbi:MAG: pentapeptide repeat-containing protein [Leptolyngbyaceae cyanobacterium MO_188.B28]|nr:pentapeptide repeat-containing protein [Leptolyngbyaceae cyanobacterium MO_188.B28]